ncbi:S-layer homology domain-containing protein [Demequina flava]|uniref:S-layer homology domain-containing protein n=1 Tax=Demequina flava TaxID=1095025 RepID=UPI0007856F4F|nr:S-layer homology domain-containing protein [Demequina flava]
MEIAWLAQAGIALGTLEADGTYTFRPHDLITRSEASHLLYRFTGQPAFDEPEESPFSDVDASESEDFRHIAWVSDEVVDDAWGIETDEEFWPDAEVSRAAIATLLYRYAGSPEVVEPETRTFTDVDPGSPFFEAVQWLSDTEIVTGWDGEAGTEFRPHDSMTRGGFAALLYRLDLAGIWYGSSDGDAPLLRHSEVEVLGSASATLRSGPGPSHDAVTTVPPGTILSATGAVSWDGWIEVLADGTRAWAPGSSVAGDDRTAIARVSATATNGELQSSHLCALSWDRDELLLCQAAEDLERLNSAFHAEFGIAIPVSDSYRDFSGQVRAKSVFGFLAATPGTSNHGWGVAIDISEAQLPGGFSGEAYTWLTERLSGYNWVLPNWARPSGNKPEPWHFEYTG